ncbi:hypothetical protein GLYMA_20G168850v4 [Glycine max]|nr:hypothetical protein GLYMA_20G168850v4 [Glycine max]KAH1036512.1 hypothetical protein GYH30_056120 [Glycine max]
MTFDFSLLIILCHILLFGGKSSPNIVIAGSIFLIPRF